MTDFSIRTSEPPRARPRLGWVLGLTSAAYFMVVLDALVVITAVPHMRRDLHAGFSTLQWTVNSYGMPAVAAGMVTGRTALPVTGSAADLRRRRGAVHGRFGRLRPGAERVAPDLRAHAAGARWRRRPRAEPDDPDRSLPGRAPRRGSSASAAGDLRARGRRRAPRSAAPSPRGSTGTGSSGSTSRSDWSRSSDALDPHREHRPSAPPRHSRLGLAALALAALVAGLVDVQPWAGAASAPMAC